MYNPVLSPSQEPENISEKKVVKNTHTHTQNIISEKESTTSGLQL